MVDPRRRRWLRRCARDASSTALALAPILGISDLKEFELKQSEFTELKVLGDISQRFPSLSRLYLGVLSKTIVAGLGFDGLRIATIETDDPDALGDSLQGLGALNGAAKPASFAPVGSKREVLQLALRELHAVAPTPVDVISLPEGAPFGKVEVNVDGCTLCLSCVSACPTGALLDDPERPMLRFTEDACVQCGLCKSTCPEKVISLKPQIDFRAATASSRVIKQEDPFLCIRCGAPFGVKSSVERVAAKLEDKHWMYKGPTRRIDLVKMCADCRVQLTAEENFDPFGAPQRPRLRTTDDYLRARQEEGES